MFHVSFIYLLLCVPYMQIYLKKCMPAIDAGVEIWGKMYHFPRQQGDLFWKFHLYHYFLSWNAINIDCIKFQVLKKKFRRRSVETAFRAHLQHRFIPLFIIFHSLFSLFSLFIIPLDSLKYPWKHTVWWCRAWTSLHF